MKIIVFVIAALGLISLTAVPGAMHFYGMALGDTNVLIGSALSGIALFSAIVFLILALMNFLSSDEKFWNVLALLAAVFGIGLAHLYASVGQEVTLMFSVLVTLGIASVSKLFLNIGMSRAIPALLVMFLAYDIAVIHNVGGSGSYLESLCVFAIGLLVGNAILFYRPAQHDPNLIKGLDY